MLDFALLASSVSAASVLHGMYDIFASAGRDWEVLVLGKPGESCIRPKLVAVAPGSFQCANGIWIKPDTTLAEMEHPEVIVIPELAFVPGQPILPSHAAEFDWILNCYQQGTVLATACTGAILLAEGGLLDGCQATTHWGLAGYLRENFPAIEVNDKRSLLVTGEDHRIIMAGGATSFLDLAVYLIARFVSVEEAMRVAKVWLIDWHDLGQQPYAALARARQLEDKEIERCQRWIAMNYEREAPVAAMVEMSGLAERSFKRRFHRATGMTPIEYVQTLRLEESKLLLETSRQSIEAVATDVGYEDASSFNRLFKRKVGITPAQYRKRFGSMRQKIMENLPE